MDFGTLITSLLLTAFFYMAFPVIRLLLNHGQFERKTAKKIALWNSIIVGAIFCVLTPVLGGGAWNAAPAILYYWINKALLTKKSSESFYDDTFINGNMDDASNE